MECLAPQYSKGEVDRVGSLLIGTNDPVKSSSQSVGIDWPVLTYWVTYLSIVFGILYAVISEAF